MNKQLTLGAPEIDPDDIGYNTTGHTTLNTIIAARMSRRRLLGFGIASGGAALLAACGGGSDDDGSDSGNGDGGDGGSEPPVPLALSFGAVAKALDDWVTVPAGYTASVLYRLGDPIASDADDYNNDGTDDPASYDYRAGDHHDGMTYFGLKDGQWDASSADRGLLVMNHESLTPLFLHPAGRTVVDGVRTVASEVQREFRLHGVSVIEVNRGADNSWSYSRSSSFNRRVTALTEMAITGPAAGSDFVKTKYSPDGTRVRGTVNNCANGTTPWGTYLACEENWAGYFSRTPATDNAQRSAKELAAIARYGVGPSSFYGLWATTVAADPSDAAEQDEYDRWRAEVTGSSSAEDYRNTHNTYGWVVEINPFDAASTPKKRTALGRFGHEGACLGPVAEGKPLVWYMGDDARGEYLYKFVSDALWDPADASNADAGDKYMTAGKLYVARFDEDGTGEWLHLTLDTVRGYADYAFANEADVYVHTRLAADAVGATPMDRPEWTAINPINGDAYLTLTNSNAANRPVDGTDAANPRSYTDPNGGGGNPNGHVIRFADTSRDPAATTFQWDVYLFGARSTADATNVNISQLSDDNDFSSPDGLWFSQANPGLLWLETDDGAYTDVTNCMLLAALPGEVGDGGAYTVTNTGSDGDVTQDTFVGKAPGEDGLRRFLVGPKGCEITGIAESPDGRALFINIQHPGEDTEDITTPANFQSHWPYGGNAATYDAGSTARPRSATLVITRDDGGPIGV